LDDERADLAQLRAAVALGGVARDDVADLVAEHARQLRLVRASASRPRLA
jgi:hypothetical protein